MEEMEGAELDKQSRKERKQKRGQGYEKREIEKRRKAKKRGS